MNIVINNAGITRVPLTHTMDGFELQLATNYLGAFALTTCCSRTSPTASSR